MAEQYLKELYATYHGMVGGIFYEEPAPLDTLEFMELLINNGLKAI
ncbi:hypothetical protein L2089_08165 [Paenibacillus hunanensis]|nr:hypothetical protein [Paenibacillus hunanensis]MCL9660653.1 hypothetical protein [Paenibacillus hunanensis]